MAQLDEWWVDTAVNDIARTVPKIEEYGTRDLEAMGTAFMLIQNRTTAQSLSEPGRAVYAIMFYAMGKIARAVAALERGKMPSEDTLFDLSIYAMMARAYAERGSLE